MTKVFFCEKTTDYIFHRTWWCNTCKTVPKREYAGRGPYEDFGKASETREEPVVCPTCGRQAEQNGSSASPVYCRKDTGEELSPLRDHPGACYEEDLPFYDRLSRSPRTGPDGRVLVVILPNGAHWTIDSRASNCDMKHDNEHRCWVRHGSPEEGNLHVDKNGLTCNAGAGSIDMLGWHGYLHNGELKKC